MDMIYGMKVASATVFRSDIMRSRKVEWRSVFLLVTQRSVLHPHSTECDRSSRVNDWSLLMGPELQATCECVVERKHPGMTARLGSAWHGNERRDGAAGFLSAFIISLPTQGEKVFGAARERAPDSVSWTPVTWHSDTCLYLLLLLLVGCFFSFVLLKKSGATSGNRCQGSRTWKNRAKQRQLRFPPFKNQDKSSDEEKTEMKSSAALHNTSRNIR